MMVFLDTNVWLSATLFSGICSELIMECVEHEWLVSSLLVQCEAHEVLTRKFPHRPDAPALFDAIWCAAAIVEDVCEPADDADARLVTAACTAGCELFVTGDRRVLSWTRSKTMRIVTPRQAWLTLFPPPDPH